MTKVSTPKSCTTQVTSSKKSARDIGRKISNVLVTEIANLFDLEGRQHLFHSTDQATKTTEHVSIPAWAALKDNPVLSKYDITCPDKKMTYVERSTLRWIVDLPNDERFKGSVKRESQRQPSPPNLMEDVWAPSIGRRSPQYVRRDVMQLRTNVPLAFNDYTDMGLKWYGESEYCRNNEQRTDKYNRLISEYANARSWGVYYEPHRTQDYRGRIQIDTGELRGKQGDKLMKLITHSAIAKPTDLNDPQVFRVIEYVLRKGYGFDISEYDKVHDRVVKDKVNPVDEWGVPFTEAYLMVRQIKETGSSTALAGVDMIGSVVMLVTLLYGNKSFAQKMNLFKGGLPWEVKRQIDIWCSAVVAYRRACTHLRGSGVHDADFEGSSLYHAIRSGIVKGPGTGFSFGAGGDTMGYMLAGLTKGRDDERLATGDSDDLKAVTKRLSWSPLFEQDPRFPVTGSTQQKVDYLISHAKKVVRPIFKKHLRHVDIVTTLIRTAVKNRVMLNDETYREVPLCAIPSFEFPDGFVIHPMPIRRSHFNTHPVESSGEKVYVSDKWYDTKPELMTCGIHGLEAYIDAALDREWFGTMGMNTGQSVFEARYMHFVDIPAFYKMSGPVVKECISQARESNPIPQFCEDTGVKLRKPQFDIADIPDDVMIYSA